MQFFALFLHYLQFYGLEAVVQMLLYSTNLLWPTLTVLYSYFCFTDLGNILLTSQTITQVFIIHLRNDCLSFCYVYLMSARQCIWWFGLHGLFPHFKWTHYSFSLNILHRYLWVVNDISFGKVICHTISLTWWAECHWFAVLFPTFVTIVALFPVT